MTAVEEARERGRELAAALAADGVAGVTIAWADNNGIPRSRTVPVSALPQVAATGVGVTTLFAVFDTNDAITFAAPGLQTPSGDVRLVPQLDRVTRLAGQPAFAWAPGRQITAEGGPWAFDQRSVLERTVARLAEAGYSALVGYEMEFAVYEQPQAEGDDSLVPAHPGPAYSPHALLPIDDFVASVMRDAEANGLRLGQVHAEYGPAQVELSLAATDPVTAADQQLLARQTVLAAAEAHGLRVSFAPLPTLAGRGQRLARAHLALARRGEPARRRRRGTARDGRRRVHRRAAARPARGGRADAPRRSARSPACVPGSSPAPSRSGAWRTARRRCATSPARRCSARTTPTSSSRSPTRPRTPTSRSPRSSPPASAGVEENLAPPAPIGEDPGTWKKKERAAAGIAKLPASQAEQEEALVGNPRIAGVLGEELLGAFLAVRRADAAWAQEKETEEVLAAWRWKLLSRSPGTGDAGSGLAPRPAPAVTAAGQARASAHPVRRRSASAAASGGSRVSWSRVRALAMGAATVGCAASHARETAAIGTACAAAISSSTPSSATPRSSR